MKSIKVYNYDNNGYFIGESLAYESPLENGVYVLPKNSTTTEPELQDGFIPKFKSGVWEQVSNYKGRQVYDITTKEMVIVDYFGDIKEGYTHKAPNNDYQEFIKDEWTMTEKSYTEFRIDLKTKFRQLREKEISTAEVEYKDKKFKGDRGTALEVDAYINAFQRAIPLGLRQPTDIVARWRTQDNSYIDLYIEDMISISLLQTQVVATAFAKQEALELQLFTIPDEELLDLDVENLWNNINGSSSSIS
ncbi:hypothetical protein [Francisella philomiragia]|uniref:DUF4376 domain-containing protein n=1 Tax=Francisella philomiragia TaxID=28110 RepID=A0ABS1GCY0_9GAMM|nr:hypothetical protein [Francisella philomiragia]MBK2258993.1 hypothetical protein [Francisella philomiragia]MBK2302684.1 hypothetical protein [Francisella philomiragia]